MENKPRGFNSTRDAKEKEIASKGGESTYDKGNRPFENDSQRDREKRGDLYQQGTPSNPKMGIE